MTKICVMRPTTPYHGMCPNAPVRYLKSYGWGEVGDGEATYETTTQREEARLLGSEEAHDLEMGNLHDILVSAHGHWDTRYTWHFETA